MKKAHLRASWFLLTAVILFGAVGCNLPSNSEAKLQTSVAETVAVSNLDQPPVGTADIQAPPPALPGPTQTSTLNPTVTLSQTITTSPAFTLTPTLEAPMASVSTNTNCRTGPGTIYDIVGALLVGEQAEVVGREEYGNYWIIKNPDGTGECWLWGYYATVTEPTDGLLVYTPPPTPTPAFDWGGSWTVSIGPAGGGIYTTWSMTAIVTGKTFTGNIDFVGLGITFNGTISDDYLTVSGNWQEAGLTGPFKFYAVGVNQFQGYNSLGPDVAGMCGAKGGAGQPSPCYRP